MLLTISTTDKPTTDLGYLVHKNPFRSQGRKLSFGTVNVFYPEATRDICTLAILLEIDPLHLARGKGVRVQNATLSPYVNDRPYVCSSFMSIALSRLFGQTLNGTCRGKPELVDRPMDLKASISVLPSKPGETFLKSLFEPLGYRVDTVPHLLDPSFPEWGQSPYFTVTLSGRVTVKALFNHLYVLIPVLDNQKHYFIDENEIQKLLQRGEGWLSEHPLRNVITRRYLKYLKSYEVQALESLEETPETEGDPEVLKKPDEPAGEQAFNLNRERLQTVLTTLLASGAETLLDLGCGTGKLMRLLLKEGHFKRIVGLDVSARYLQVAHERLHLDTLPEIQRNRVDLILGSLVYRDKRLEGFDAAVVIEVIEHLPPERLRTFEQVVFGCARPGMVIVTTPNREYNPFWEGMEPGDLRHKDHRFEWTRREFRAWAETLGKTHGYGATFQSVGQPHHQLGAPTQICLFTRKEEERP